MASQQPPTPPSRPPNPAPGNEPGNQPAGSSGSRGGSRPSHTRSARGNQGPNQTRQQSRTRTGKRKRVPFTPWKGSWWKSRHAAKKARLARMSRGKRIWRLVAIAFTWLLSLLALTMVISVYAFYRVTDVPDPTALRNDQVSVLEFSDGSPIGRIGNINRTDVALSAVPESLKWAVLATEDRDFYSNPGFSVTGTLRAAWNDVTGGDTQGGSGITQQYVKNAYLTDEQSLSRKLRELAISVKLNREYPKDQILEWYLNTVYFGRGAYGVQAAAQTYFGVDVGQLDVAQSAVLAALLKAPATYDPAADAAAAQGRWGFVLDSMVETKHLSPEDRAVQQFPATRDPAEGTGLGITGTNGYLVAQVTKELLANGFTQDQLDRGGLHIRTTIDPAAQAASVQAIQETYEGQPDNLRQALVAIDPATGGVLAYYGGTDGTGYDYAQAYRQPGSSFKPYVLAAALAQNLAGGSPDGKSYTLNSMFNGSSPRTIDGQVVHNSDGESCGSCSLANAMKMSINTVFYDLTSRIGPQNVAVIAQQMGISPTNVGTGEPTLQIGGETDDRISIGGYEVRTIDQASGFATFAAGGVYRPAHFVASVTTAGGAVLYQAADASKQVIDPKVANDVSVSLRPIAAYSNDGLAGGRQSGAKTGTVGIENTNDNSDSWMVGYTPQVSAAVWTGSDTLEPTYNAGGAPLYGSMLSGKAWKAFMDLYLVDAPKEPIPSTAQVGVKAGSSSAPPSSDSSAPPSSTPPPSSAPPPSSSEPTTAPTPADTSTPSGGNNGPGNNGNNGNNGGGNNGNAGGETATPNPTPVVSQPPANLAPTPATTLGGP